MPDLSSGDTAWVLASTALVLLMTPGLAFFYAGMTRSKSTVNMMMMSFLTIAVVSVLWVLYGFAEAFGHGTSGLYGSLDLSALTSGAVKLTVNGTVYPIPLLAFAAFQLMFAIITPALISGAIADRTRILTWGVFVVLWVTLVYFPVAHWVFDFGDTRGTGAGWLAGLGVEDFAGGTAVHINAGAAGLALALVLGKRVGWRTEPMHPHNRPLVLLGTGLLWFGWFGFNAGSALGANFSAAVALINTQAAAAAAVLGWLLVEKVRDKHVTSLGAASGAVAGLVAITPACAFIAPWAAVVLGLLAGVVCAFAVGLKWRLGFDDSLDTVGVHLVGGIVGCLFVGVFGTSTILGADGLLYGGGAALLGKQGLAVVAVLTYSFAATWVLGTVLERTLGFRVSREDELAGIDVAEHNESAYDFDSLVGDWLERTGLGSSGDAPQSPLPPAYEDDDEKVTV
ncbi:MAG: ammonium transporter [Candidatus Nanopelagicales bacterium]